MTAGKVPAIFNSVWIFGNIISLQAFNASIAVDGSESEPLEVTETDIHFRFHSSSSASTMFAELTLSKGMRPHLPHPPLNLPLKVFMQRRRHGHELRLFQFQFANILLRKHILSFNDFYKNVIMKQRYIYFWTLYGTKNTVMFLIIW